jgi:hypothetical protein
MGGQTAGTAQPFTGHGGGMAMAPAAQPPGQTYTGPQRPGATTALPAGQAQRQVLGQGHLTPAAQPPGQAYTTPMVNNPIEQPPGMLDSLHSNAASIPKAAPGSTQYNPRQPGAYTYQHAGAYPQPGGHVGQQGQQGYGGYGGQQGPAYGRSVGGAMGTPDVQHQAGSKG